MTEFEPREDSRVEGEALRIALGGSTPDEAPTFDRALRPTSALEMLDRTFLLWRQGAAKFLLYGLGMVILPAVVQTQYLLRESPAAPERVIPWYFVGLLVQVFFAAMCFRLTFHLSLGSLDTAGWKTVLLHIFPRVVFVGLLYIFGIVFCLSAFLLFLDEGGGGPIGLFLGPGAIALTIWFAATFALSLPLAALSEDSVLAALAWSRRLMARTRFCFLRWRDNAYVRLFLLVLFPLAANVLLQAVVRVVWWLQSGQGVMIGAEPLELALWLVWAGAALDVFTVPWLCIGLSLLALECLFRFHGLDLAMNLGESGIDSLSASS